jgi:autotransporter-associated beta strand protein
VTGNGYTLTKNGGSELAVNVAVNNCKIIINSGQYTFMNALALGSTDFVTVMNSGNLQSYGGNYTLNERITCNGGRFSTWGYNDNPRFNIAGYVTLNSNVEIRAGTDISYSVGTLELSGFFDGAGGLTRIVGQNTNYVYITGDTNTYSGPTIINGGAALYVGKPNVYSGVLGYGAVTNNGTLYAYSSRLGYGPLVNQGSLYCYTGLVSMGSAANSGNVYLLGGMFGTGLVVNSGNVYQNTGALGLGNVTNTGKIVLGGVGSLGTGTVVNSGNVYCYSSSLGAGTLVNLSSLYFDATNQTCMVTNTVGGSGTTFLRYGESLTLGGMYSNSVMRVGMGTLTLTNGAVVVMTNGMSIAERQVMGYSSDPSNVVATINIRDGASLTMYALSAGNGSSGSMTGIVNQTGGSVLTTGWTGDPVNFKGEYDGLHLGHYPNAYTEWNIGGGSLTIDNGYRLAIAIDGTGWFHQTGGEVFSQSVVVNARDASPGGYGRLTLEGGALNVGSNGISVGKGAAYLVEYGGAGGIVRAMTNFTSSLNATLYGTNANAVTFDTTNWTIELSGTLSGTGGLNKAGSGTLVLSGTNVYAGTTRILAGAVQLEAKSVGPTGTVAFAVSADGAGGMLSSTGNLALAKMTVAVANPEALDKSRSYAIASWSGALTSPFGASALPGPWYVYYDWASKTAYLRASVGTTVLVR